MKQIDLSIPEPVTIDDGEGTTYSGIVHIETGPNGYAETEDGEVILMEDMNEHMLVMIEQLIKDYGNDV